ncbi:MAG: hypothetical protein AAB425_15870, partial [Bdellovibrionota bacterium]
MGTLTRMPTSLSPKLKERWLPSFSTPVARMGFLRDAASEAHQIRGARGANIAAWVRKQGLPIEKKTTTRLTSALLKKLDREDREWELKIAWTAVALGWRAWLAEAKITVSEAGRFHSELIDTLWPRGILLYSESGTPPLLPDGRWNGRWVFVCDPKLVWPHAKKKEVS